MNISEWVKQEQAGAIEHVFEIERPKSFLLKEIPVLTFEVSAQLGFTKPMTEESVVDRIARLEVEGHRS